MSISLGFGCLGVFSDKIIDEAMTFIAVDNIKHRQFLIAIN